MSGESAAPGDHTSLEPRSPDYARRTRFWGVATIVSAVGILVPPLVGLGMTVFSMIFAFDAMGEAGGSDPTELSGNISAALFTTVVGIIVSVIFLVLFLVALVFWLINLSARSNAERN